ncbi:arginine--tRNA ligase, cytoplasmic-like [Papaver somniferum]|uniref:arginine--tRNA ligase, cytoplasmic-like n=1 Tax=Papaver somniferum TaxID=3469 RepID=UPI000E6F4C20|nr:arginine--tRNA ligase, cytoplasmic-like [Papaver somniferum]
MSTIIGDTIAKLLEFCRVECSRIALTADYGSEIAATIEQLLEKYPTGEGVETLSIGKLQRYSNFANKRLNDDGNFSEKAKQGLILLQEGGSDIHDKAWDLVRKISQKHFHQIYERLGVFLAEQCYKSYIPKITNVLNLLEEQALLLGFAGVDGNKAAAWIKIDDKKTLL